LCDITHTLFRRKSSWLDAEIKLKAQFGISFNAYHRNDQPSEVRKLIAGAYPAVVARDQNDELHVFMDEHEITRCGKSPESFLDAIIQKLL
jgi:hypothetical protein